VYSFIETKTFGRLVQKYLSDDEYCALQTALIENPEAGPVISGSGGVRKLRWAAPKRGKRGGFRIIYFLQRAQGLIWMLTMYSKNVTDTLSADVLRKIRAEIEDGEKKEGHR
jgi:mRNA-degrading endonuclease RelE of RelBE toxin-antitoxin system